jgi:tetratricopeptide (TPR) repeat protein
MSMAQPFPVSRNYMALIRGLLRMHRLAANGQFESGEADALRDAMDQPWEGLSEAERKRISGLSTDLNKISEIASEKPPVEMNPQAQEKLVEAYEAKEKGEWDKALDLLRRWEKYIPAALGSYLRGSIWRAAGDLAVAAIFFDHASRLDPDNGNYQAVLLHTLKNADPTEAATRAEHALAESEARFPATVVYALEIVFESTREATETQANSIYRRLIPILERTLVRLDERADVDSPALIGMTLVLLASCHEHLGDTRRAYEFYSRAIQRDPRNDVLLTARGQLAYDTTLQSAADFEQAVQLGSPLVWPYFFLAHYYLANNRLEDARSMCERGLHTQSSARVKSELQEFLAISQAGLGYPEDVVRRAFESAIRTEPSNDRARRNLERFEIALSSRAPRPQDWERPSESALRVFRREEVWTDIPSMSLREPELA